jgi:hypothetical protein
VHRSQFAAPGDQPGLLALSHVREKGTTSSSSYSFGSHASMPGTACHRHATLAPP